MKTKNMLDRGVFRGVWGTAFAQDIAGDWQGTLKGPQELPLIVHVEKGDRGAWKASLASID
jgi:hypothetical protein